MKSIFLRILYEKWEKQRRAREENPFCKKWFFEMCCHFFTDIQIQIALKVWFIFVVNFDFYFLSESQSQSQWQQQTQSHQQPNAAFRDVITTHMQIFAFFITCHFFSLLTEKKNTFIIKHLFCIRINCVSNTHRRCIFTFVFIQLIVIMRNGRNLMGHITANPTSTTIPSIRRNISIDFYFLLTLHEQYVEIRSS